MHLHVHEREFFVSLELSMSYYSKGEAERECPGAWKSEMGSCALPDIIPRHNKTGTTTTDYQRPVGAAGGRAGRGGRRFVELSGRN